MPAASIVYRVAVMAPLSGFFDYLPAAKLNKNHPAPGTRVLVPFGRSQRIGILWQVDTAPAETPYALKPITAILDEAPLLDNSLLELLGWCARYYHHPLGEVAALALPTNLRQDRQLLELRTAYWCLSVPADADLAKLERAAPVQAKVVAWLQEQGGSSAADAMQTLDGDVRGALKRLEAKGWVKREQRAVEPKLTVPVQPPLQLNSEQQAAFAAVVAACDQFQPFVLQGVTGSGKTEVYLHLAQHWIDQGKQVLLLVPEIALTPQLLQRLQQGIRAHIVALHSGLNDGERERAWRECQSGMAQLLIGTRSAVFASLPALGLIIVDEEHDLSYKQQEGLRYSARDLAVMRAKLSAIPIVLGSATPALETMLNLQQGRYQRLRLRSRAGAAQAPQLRTIDIRKQQLHSGLSADLLTAVRARLQAGEQVILFLNRRGYAPQQTCHACGWIAVCQHCDARLTYHAAAHRLWCHHCGFQQGETHVCPACGSDALTYLGQGTERLEENLGELFAGAEIVRLDRDTTRRKGALEARLDIMRSGRPGILIGTQMVAKGHDFPNVTLVGILDIDQGLLHPDFRGAERAAQLLLQVAGRAGRASKPGQVLIQTRHPEHPLLEQLLKGDYDAFAEQALAERLETGFPPYSFQVMLRAESRQQSLTSAFLDEAAAQARTLLPGVDVWGPVPAPMERKAGHFRGHLLLQAPQRAQLHAHLDQWLAAVRASTVVRKVRWHIDVDPLEAF